MCLIAFAWNVHPDFPLLLIANRDEFHARPAAPLARWTDAPGVLAGRDLQERGTWLGAASGSRFAAVTNVRAADASQRLPRSRGALVSEYLSGSTEPARFAHALQPTAAQYGGFNLLLLDHAGLHYVSNRPVFKHHPVAPGLHALSNAKLDSPWPKATAARAAMGAWLARDLADEETLFAAMSNPARAADADLPDTGVGLETERLLSSAFIRTPGYGTRCTTLVKLDRDGHARLRERRFDPSGQPVGETELDVHKRGPE